MEMTTLGGMISLQRGYDLTESQRRRGNVPVVGSAGVHGYHDTAKAKGPGVTLGRSGASFGKVTFVREDYWPHNTTLYVTDFKGNEPLFIRYLLESLDLSFLNSGSAQQSLNRNYVYGVPVRKFALPLQRRVVGILSAYDRLIENNTRRIRILEEMAQAIYREWFVHFRFPDHKKVKLVTSSLGPIPEGWSVAKLADIADVNALSIRRDDQPKEIVYIDIASVSPGSIDEARRMKFEDAPGRARRIVRHGDIIWSMVRPNRRSHALVLDPEPNLIVSTGFGVVSATRVPYSYLYHALTTDEFVGYLANHATGAAYPAVKAEDFEKAQILQPARDSLDRFHALAGPMLELKDGLARKNRNLRRTRDLSLPKLISGEVDVSRLDIQGDEAT